MRKSFTLIELMAVILVLAILMSLSLVTVNLVRSRAVKASTLNDATQLKNAIVNFLGENQRFPRVNASDDVVLSVSKYQDLIEILRGESRKDNRRKKVYLSKSRLDLNESASQYKCRLVPQVKDREANFWVILDLNDDGIRVGSRTLNESVLVFGYNKPTSFEGASSSSIRWADIDKNGVKTSNF